MTTIRIPYGRQSISDQDIDAVIRILKSDFLTTGPTIDAFERAVAEYCGARYAVAVANASVALQLACRVLDLGPGQSLWTTPNTFVASANCADHCGARIDFCDIDPSTLNLSVKTLEAKLAATPAHQHPRVVVPVHFAGQPCDMEELGTLSQKYGFKIVEDAAHAIGAEYKGEKIGGCRHSAMTVFSFHPVKNITTGEGGMITTNDENLYVRLRELRTLGITRDPNRMSRPCPGPWYYEQLEVGYNFRMTDLEAALGLSQLQRLDQFIGRRQELVDTYNQSLHDLPLKLPTVTPARKSAHHLYVVEVLSEARKDRAQVFQELREAGIGVNVHYIPVHLQPVYRKQGFQEGDFPKAEGYYQRALSLPIYFDLSSEEQQFVIARLRHILT